MTSIVTNKVQSAKVQDRKQIKDGVAGSFAVKVEQVDPAPIARKKKKKSKHSHCKRVSDKTIKKINALTKEGWSDTWISEQPFCVKRKLTPTQVMLVRYEMYKDLDKPVLNPKGKPKPTNKNKNTPPKNKGSDTRFGGPRGNKPWHQMLDRIDPETGLPQVPKGIGKPRGSRDVNLLITDCFGYSVQELKKILRHKQLDGRSLSAGVLMIVKQVLVSLTGSPKESLNATKWLIERKYGSVTAKIANGDGTNIANPLMALLTQDSRLKPNT